MMATSPPLSLEQVIAESGVNSECLDQECDQDKLLALADCCDSLIVTGSALGLTETQINDITRDSRYVSYEDKRIALIFKWKQSFAFKATYGKFVEALMVCGRADQATELCRELAKEYQGIKAFNCT